MARLAQLFTVLLLAFVAAVLASPRVYIRDAGSIAARSASGEEPLTNGARLARGLAPLPPRALYSPTRVRRTSTSPVPGQPLTGHIALYSGTSVAGYVRADNNIVVGSANAATTFTYTPGNPVAFEWTTNNGARRYWGAATTSAGTRLGQGRSDYLSTHSVSLKVPAGAAPIYFATDGVYAETTIFYVDAATLAIAPQWVNADGGQPATRPVLWSSQLYYTGDVAAFAAARSGNPASVSMVFVPT
ncbi:hypothetical protein GLOTRDRAFT_119176 [Gloeophyllum trabeum ATCC 11539]|uniref:Concanavalin A-like lectin/glucanase n=1 Tax=Gloeophyllum trabeum (strain ATCC 11539 / FP-39264 / Madison 617) TaxID=670483 RepID=S7QP03_GLOTA|nr:uncharacterized protein GLOTRDRAFT_119176 [Gloeophyllum trabeum ATCC 11539]EPQ61306.1 hypothetical protein GLOTRDRAFT_119176 [Gloeophyllum trabeum ATCC 11539]